MSSLERQGSSRSNGSATHVVEWIKRRGSLTATASNRMRRSSEKPPMQFSNDVTDYQILYMMGQGASANVFMAKYLKMDAPVAIKQINIERFERKHIDELRNEIQIMSLCRHPNLLPIHKCFTHTDNLWIITPVQNGGSVADLIQYQYPSGIDEVCCATVLKQVVQGLLYLHNNSLIHRDIKCANMLLCTDTGLVQLSDFGVSKTLMDYGRKTSRKTFVGTLAYMAPEMMEEKAYNEKIDIWSLGISMIELASGKPPYGEYAPLKTIMLTLRNPAPTLDDESMQQSYGKAAKAFVGACLHKDPEDRMDCATLQDHAFLKKAKQPLSLVSQLHLKGLKPLHERSITMCRMPEEIQAEIDWDFSQGPYVPKEQDDSKDSGYLSRQSSYRRSRRDSMASQETETSQKGRFIVETPVQSPSVSRSGSLERKSRFEVRKKSNDS